MTSLARRCTACGQLGHNTRTCPGVVESVPRMVKSRSMPVLGMLRSSSLDDLVSAAAEEAFEDDGEPEPRELGSCREEGGEADEAPEELRNERRKGVPWSEAEHRLFLVGLAKLGKGDWRGISRGFVHSRTPTQVASHAQKFFLRQQNLTKRKRRSSLFDIVTGTGTTPPPFQAPAPASAWPPPPPSSLFGGLPSGSSAAHLLLSASQSTPQQGVSDAACGALYAQWLLSGGGSLGGAEFHRPGAQALADNPRLFKPVPHRATAATWGMVKSASMPELGELTMDDLPPPQPPQPTARAHSNLKPQEVAVHGGDGCSHAQPQE